MFDSTAPSKGAYYNELESFPCEVIRRNIALGRLPEGEVCERDIREIQATDVRGHSQIHLFAGIGAAAYACRLAGVPDDFSICTFGFPCQDISTAGKGAGLDGDRSGLFFEAMRIIRSVRPTWLLAENVPALRTRGIERVLAEMESAGYCALPPVVVGADDVGAPQRRKRVWIVCRLADAQHGRREAGSTDTGQLHQSQRHEARNAADGYGAERNDARVENSARTRTRDVSARPGTEGRGARDADGSGLRLGDAGCQSGETTRDEAFSGGNEWQSRGESGGAGVSELADADGSGRREQRVAVAISAQHTAAFSGSVLRRWPSRCGESQHDWEEPRIVRATLESAMGGAVDGASRRLVRLANRRRTDALKGLGNAWCPQTAVPILKWMGEMEKVYVRAYT